MAPGEPPTGSSLRGTRTANILGLRGVLATNMQFLWMVCGLLSPGSGSSKRPGASPKSHRATDPPGHTTFPVSYATGSPFTLSLGDLNYQVWRTALGSPQTILFETREHTSLSQIHLLVTDVKQASLSSLAGSKKQK